MLKKTPKAVLFDWDNTLIDSMKSIDTAISNTLKQMGSSSILKNRYKYISRKEFLVDLFGNRWKEANTIYQKYLEQQSPVEDLSLNIGVKEMLRNLKRYNLYLAIVSNKEGNNLRQEVKNLGLSDFFNKIVGSGDASEDKPSPLPVLFALEGSKIKPSNEVLFIGDSITDVQCAINANCLPIVYGEPMTGYENLFSFKNFEKFIKFIISVIEN